MRILQAMAGAEKGGAEAFFERLVIALNKAGIEQKVVIRKSKKRKELFLDNGITPIEVPFGGPFDLITPIKLKTQIKKFKPDIAMSWMNRASKFMPKGDFVHVARLGGYYNLKYYDKCDYLIGNTKDIVDYLIKENWDEDKAFYVPNFVSEKTSNPIKKEKLNIPQKANVIFALGRLHENKAFDVLINALTRVDNTYLVIAGKGPLEKQLKELATKKAVKPKIRFVGWVDDPSSYFSMCDIMVCPSRHEPLGNVVIEGWAQQKPVISAASQGPTQLIKHNKNGVLVPIDDDIKMSEEINRILSDKKLAGKIAKSGYDTYKRNFSEEIIVEKYIEFFKKIIKRGKAG